MNVEKIKQLLESGKEINFYMSSTWQDLAAKVRRMDRYECQLCKARGRYSRGVIVHHVKHLRDRPALALSVYDPDSGERQLVTVCKKCHEDQHPEALRERESTTKDEIARECWE